MGLHFHMFPSRATTGSRGQIGVGMGNMGIRLSYIVRRGITLRLSAHERLCVCDAVATR